MSDIRTEHHRLDVSADGETLTLDTAVGSLSSAFIIMTANRHTGTGTRDGSEEIDDLSVMAELTATDTVTFTRPATTPTYDIDVALTVVEYTGAAAGVNEFIVRSRNTIDIESVASTTATMDNAPTDIDKCIPFIVGGVTTQTTNGSQMLVNLIYLSGTNTINVETTSSSANGQELQICVVEFTGSNWSVGHGRINGSANDTGTIDLVEESDGIDTGTSFDVSDWATAAIVTWSMTGVDDSGSQHHWPVFREGSATTDVDFEFDASHTGGSDDDIMIHVLQHDDLDVTRYGETQVAGTFSEDVDITTAGLTDLTEALALITFVAQGANAYPRNWRIVEFTTTTNCRYVTSYDGQRNQTEIQIIDFADVASGTGVEVSAVLVASTASVPAPAAGQTAVDVEPASISAAVAIPTPSTDISVSVSPGQVGLVLSTPSATVSVGSAVDASVVSALASILVPTLTGGGLISPSAVEADVTMPTPSAGSNTLVSPSVVDTDTTIPTPSVAASGEAVPALVGTSLSIDAVAASVGVAPAVLQAALLILAPTVDIEVAVSPITATTTIPAIEIDGAIDVSPGQVSVQVTIPTLNISSGVVVSPAVADILLAVNGLSIGEATVDPFSITLTITDSGHSITVGGQGHTSTVKEN